MKFKRMMPVIFLLLAVLTISAVSAEDNMTSDELTVEEDEIIEYVDNASELSDASDDQIAEENKDSAVTVEPLNTHDTLWVSVEDARGFGVRIDNESVFSGENRWTAIDLDSLNISYGIHDLKVNYLLNDGYKIETYKTSFMRTYVDVIVSEMYGETILIQSEEEMNAKLYLDGELIYNGKIDQCTPVASDKLFLGYVPNYTIITNGKGKFNPIKFTGSLSYDEIRPNVYWPDGIIKGDDEYIRFSLPKDADGNLSIYINGSKIDAKFKNGKSAYCLKNLDIGTYEIKVIYNSDSKYKSFETEFSLNVIKNPNFKFTASGKIVENVKSKIIITGDSDFEGTVSIQDSSAQFKNGTATLTIKPTNSGNQTFEYTFENNDVRLTKTFNIYVHAKLPKITASNFQKDYLSNKKYNVRISDGISYAGTGKTVKFEFYNYGTYGVADGKKMATKTAKTDKNGFVKLNLNLQPGYYKVKIKYGSATVTKKYTVNSIVRTKMIFTKKSKIVLPIYLKKVDGKYLKGKKIKITFCRDVYDKKGKLHLKKIKTYTKKTDKKGVATLTFKKSPIKISSDEMINGYGFSVTLTYLKDVTYRGFTLYSKSPFKYLWGWGSYYNTKTGLY